MGCPPKIGEGRLFKPAGKQGLCQTRIRRYGKHWGMLALLLLMALITGCRDKGTNPPEIPEYDILSVEVDPNPVATGDSVWFLVQTNQEVAEGFWFGWILNGPGNGSRDTLTQTNQLGWLAPPDSGTYTHTVWLETREGESVSEEFIFTVDVVPHELTKILEVEVSPNPVISGDTARFAAVLKDTIDSHYRFRWYLQGLGLEVTDTVTAKNTLTWVAPEHDRLHEQRILEHAVQVETETEEVLSGEYPFSVMVDPKPPNPTHIVEVTVTPNPVTNTNTSLFTAYLNDEIDPRYRFRWQLEQPDGSISDTVTESTEFEWLPPEQENIYEHRVQVETESGETLSSSFAFSATVVSPTDAFYDQADLLFSVESDIKLMNTETGEIRTLAEGSQPRWSLDGQQVAFTGQYEHYEAHQIFSMNVDGTSKRVASLWEYNGQLEPHPNTSSGPVWSPNGQHLAYSRCEDCEIGGGNYEVFIVALDTTSGLQETRVTDNIYSDYVYDWSTEEGKLLIISRVRPDGSINKWGGVYTVNPDGSGKELILEADSTFGIGVPRYSSDGSRIAFIGGRNETNEIYITNSDGDNIQQVTDNDQRKCSMEWLPDDTGLIFVMGPTSCRIPDSRQNHIYTINLDGTGLQQLTSEPGAYDDPEWRPERD